MLSDQSPWSSNRGRSEQLNDRSPAPSLGFSATWADQERLSANDWCAAIPLGGDLLDLIG